MTAFVPDHRPTAEECLRFEPLASADVKAGVLLPDKKQNARPALKDPRLLPVQPFLASGRSSSVKRVLKTRIPTHTFDSDPG
jgi:hypothetical protein